MKIFSDAFWQQELRAVNLAGWFVRRKVATVCSLVSGSIHLVIGILYLSLMQNAWEVRTDVFSNGQTEFEIEVPENTESVALYVEIPTFYGSYRSFTLSKDTRVVGAPLQSFDCNTGEQTLDDFMSIRGEAFRDFMKDHPLLNSAALDVNGTEKLCPCGLNSFALLLDMFELTRHGVNATVQLDETRITRSADIDFVKSNKLKTSATSDRGISGVFNRQTGDVKFDNTTCWLRGNSPTTPDHQQDRAFLRLLSFYRTSTSNSIRLLLGYYDNVQKGKYTLRATKVDPSWNQWPGAKRRRVVLSSLSPVGTRDSFAPILCIVLAVTYFSMGAILKLIRPKEL